MTATHTDASRLCPPGRIADLQALLRATSGDAVAVRSPLDGTTLARIPQSTVADVAAAFATARAAQPAWEALGARERGRRLLEFHDLLLAHQAELADVIVAETGKTRRDAAEEIAHAAMTARYYGRHGHRILRTQRRAGAVPLLTRVEVQHVPKGVVGVISPWNYPLTMAFSDGVAALAAGNTVVAKPDAQAVLTALSGLDLLRRAGVPDAVWQIVAGPGEVIGEALVERADHIAFTGSTATGRRIAARCGERLVAASLELGGKNALLVLDDADLDAAAEGAARGCFSNTGQLCVSVERVLVAAPVLDAFTERFVAATRALDLRPGPDWGSDVGTLTTAAQVQKVAAHVEDARAHGARVLVGGRARPDLAPWAYEPTILAGVTDAMAVHDTETFGPVVALVPVADDDEAVTVANATPYGLNASVWSRDPRRARAVASRLRAGSVNINEAYAATFASVAAPMGGFGDSGLGRRQGPEGLHRFTEARTVATQRVHPLRAPQGVSEERWAAALTGALRLMKWARW